MNYFLLLSPLPCSLPALPAGSAAGEKRLGGVPAWFGKEGGGKKAGGRREGADQPR